MKSQKGSEFRTLFCRAMQLLGFVETWSGGDGSLLQGHHMKRGYAAKKSRWSAYVTIRGDKATAEARGNPATRGQKLTTTQDEAGATELARWVARNAVDPT